MSDAAKVVWSEGMFLRPQHFQQAEQYLQATIRDWGQLQHPWRWGFLTLELDDTLLRQGCVALNAASGVLPDGTWFSFRHGHHGPAPLAIDDSQSDVVVVLALPARRAGRDEVIFSDAPDSLARFVTFEQEVADWNALAADPVTVQFGKLRLRLMLESELSAEWTALGIVRIREKRNDNQLQLDKHYIPPLLNCMVCSPLVDYLNDVHGLLTQRARQMGARLQQPGRITHADPMDMMLLALINRHLGAMHHLCRLPLLHPEQLFRHWLALACELATWTPPRIPDALLPVYRHDDLAGCFTPLVQMLRHGLSQVLEEQAVQLLLTDRSHGLKVATLPESRMVRECAFVLAVRASMPGESLLSHLPAQMKVAPVTRIRDLVHLQLPGIVLRPLPAAPPQIPWHAGFSYFELEKGSEWWNEIETSAVFALHLAGEFPGLEMQFWALRQSSA